MQLYYAKIYLGDKEVYKIGVSSDPVKRLENLLTNSYGLKAELLICEELNDSRDLELTVKHTNKELTVEVEGLPKTETFSKDIIPHNEVLKTVYRTGYNL